MNPYEVVFSSQNPRLHLVHCVAVLECSGAHDTLQVGRSGVWVVEHLFVLEEQVEHAVFHVGVGAELVGGDLDDRVVVGAQLVLDAERESGVAQRHGATADS